MDVRTQAWARASAVVRGTNVVSAAAAASYIAVDTTGPPRNAKGLRVEKVGLVQVNGKVSSLCAVGAAMWAGEDSGRVTMLDVDTGCVVGVVSETRGIPVTVMRVVRGHVWAGCADGLLRIYNAVTRALVSEVKLHNDRITDFALAPCSEAVFSSSIDSKIRYCNTSFVTMTGARTLSECSSAVHSLAFYSSFLFSGDDSSRIIQWNTSTKQRLHVLNVHSAPVLTMTVVNDHLWSGSADGVVCVWSLFSACGASPKCIHMITNPHEGPVTVLKSLGLKVWSVSAGQLYIWNPSSFELEAHCRLRNEGTGAFDVVETATQVVSIKTWASYTEDGKIAILESGDILSPQGNPFLSSGTHLREEEEERERLIAQLLEAKKYLTLEVISLRRQLSDLQLQLRQRRNILPTFEMTNSGVSKEPISSVHGAASATGVTNMSSDPTTGFGGMRNTNIRDSIGIASLPVEQRDKLKHSATFPHYVVVDVHVLLERLICLRGEVDKLLVSEGLQHENSYLYFAEENCAPPLPIGYITLAELTHGERETLSDICGGAGPPFILPTPSQRDISADMQSMLRIINRVRPFYSFPSSASSDIRSMIHTFTSGVQLSQGRPVDHAHQVLSVDDVGYPPISFYLKDILRDVVAMVHRRSRNQKSSEYHRVISLEAKLSSSSQGRDTTGADGWLGIPYPDTPFPTSFCTGQGPTSPMDDGLQSLINGVGGSSVGLIQRIHAVRRDVINCVAHHPSSRVRACTTGISPLIFPSMGDHADTEEEELRQLSDTLFKLVQQLCSNIANLEAEAQEQKCKRELLMHTPETGDIQHTVKLSDGVCHRLPGLVSLMTQVQDNSHVVYELIIQHLLGEGKRIALQYGRLMDALLQRHKPSSRPKLSWDDVQGQLNCRSSSLLFSLDALDAYDQIIENVHIMEQAILTV